MTKKAQKKGKWTTPKSPPLIVIGLDGNGKPKGARFTAEHFEQAAHASSAMKLEIFEATGEELLELAKKLPSGRIYAKGRAFIPFIKRDLYERLCAASGGLVRDQTGAIPNSDAAAGAQVSSPKSDIPAGWDAIEPGHLVLTTEGEGWWESIVLKREGDVLTLRYRDYPKLPKFDRHISTVALINPGPT